MFGTGSQTLRWWTSALCNSVFSESCFSHVTSFALWSRSWLANEENRFQTSNRWFVHDVWLIFNSKMLGYCNPSWKNVQYSSRQNLLKDWNYQWHLILYHCVFRTCRKCIKMRSLHLCNQSLPDFSTHLYLQNQRHGIPVLISTLPHELVFKTYKTYIYMSLHVQQLMSCRITGR